MATSGTYNFLMSRDDLIGAALRVTTRFGSGDVIPAEDLTYCGQALNIICKALATNVLPLWCVVRIPVPMVAGQAAYNLSALSGTTLPLRILDAYLRGPSGNDVSISLESRYDYDTLGSKASLGIPNQGFYDPQLGAGSLVLYNVPQDSLSTLYVIIQRQIQDINLATDNPDFPQEAFWMLKWLLADEVALDYSTPGDVRREIAVKAKAYRDAFMDGTQEAVSVTFAPNARGASGSR
jgi:hypothetical protein